MKKQLIILVLLVAAAAFVIFRPKAKPEIARTAPVDAAVATAAATAAGNAMTAFSQGGIKQLKPLMQPTDAMGYRELGEALERISGLQFDRAKVESPQFDPELFYVDVPAAEGRRVRLVMRRQQGRFLLVSAGWEQP